MNTKSYNPKSILNILCLCLIVTGMMGCTYIAKNIAHDIADTTIEKEFKIAIGSAKSFADCFNESGGACTNKADTKTSATPIKMSTSMPPDLKNEVSNLYRKLDTDSNRIMHLTNMATDILESNTHKKFIGIFNAILEKKSINQKDLSEPISINFTWNELDDYVSKIDEAAQLGAWDVLNQQVSLAITSNPELKNNSEVLSYERMVNYIEEYMKAYFRNGKFAKLSFDTDDIKNTIKAKLKEIYKDKIKDEDLEKLLNELVDKYLSKLTEDKDKFVFGSIGDEGFITRGGAKYQFPAIEAKIKLDEAADRQITVTKLEPIAIGNDLLRILIEATFDSYNQLPCVSNATATKLKAHVNDPDKGHDQQTPDLLAEHFEKVESWANKTESGASTVIGKLIRGGGLIALNNEALAQLIETSIGVTVRKITEKVAWCYYSCNKSDQQVNEAKAYSDTQYVKLKVQVKGKPPIYYSKPWR